MPIVISIAPGEQGESVAHLGGMLGRSFESDLVVVAVTPTPWPPSPYGADHEFGPQQRKAASEALDRARVIIGPDIAAEYLVETARSVSAGVSDVARRRSASIVVLGSTARGLVGRVSLGSVAGRLLHSLEIPVCIAPNGFTTVSAGRVERITVGFGRGDRDSDLLHVTAARAKQLGVPVRIACFAVRPSTALTGTTPPDAEDLVVAEWAENLRSDIGRIVVSAGLDPKLVPIVVAEGGSWPEVVSDIGWAPGDILAIGASTSGVSRLFLGSHASKIVRSAAAPVLIVARSRSD
jgi:nucleotide-binding universal stress UspA family protein